MAGDIPPILIDVQLEMGKIKGQLDALQSEIKQVGNAAKAQESKVGGLEGKLGKMAGSFKKMVGAAAIASVLTASAKAAAEDTESMALLNNQLKISVGANKEQMASVDAQIQKMQEATGILDNDIRPAYAALIRGTKDVATAQTLTTLALDASVAKGKDATAVANALAKAHNGSTKQLQMLFPELRNSKDMMGDLAKNVKGTAEAAADANPMKRLGAQLDVIKETLGKALLPALSALSRILKPLMPIFDLIAEVIGYVIEAVMPLVETLMQALMPAFQAIMKVIKPILEKLLPPLIKLLEKILVPVLIFLSDIIINYLVPYWLKLADVLGGVLNWAIDNMVTGFQNLTKILGPLWENVLKPLADGIMAMMGIKVEPQIKPKVDDSELAKLDYAGIGNLKIVAGGNIKTGGDGGAAAAAKEQAKAILKAQTDFQKASKKAQADYQAEITERVKDFKKSFEDATKVDVSSLFSEGYQSADLLIEGLKAKLEATKTFAADIGKLSAAGYSEDFIKQLESLGPIVGDQMTQALLSGAPGAQEEIKSLFAESTLLSATGVDSVAKNLIPTFKDATTRLGDAMVSAAVQLQTALTNIKDITKEQILGALKITSTGQTFTPAVTPSSAKIVPAPSVQNPAPTITVPTIISSPGATASEIANAIVSTIKFNNPITGQSTTLLTDTKPHFNDLNWLYDQTRGLWVKVS